jgi:hypothetical protein
MMTQARFIPLHALEEKECCATGCKKPARWVLANSNVICDECLYSFLELLQYDPFLSDEEYAACFRDYVREWLPRHILDCPSCRLGASVREAVAHLWKDERLAVLKEGDRMLRRVLKAVVKAYPYRSVRWRS